MIVHHAARHRETQVQCAVLPSNRKGSTLVIVLAVIAALGYGVYAFSEKMLLEFEGTRRLQHQVRAQVAAQSGVTFVAQQFDFGQSAVMKEVSWSSPEGIDYSASIHASSPYSAASQAVGPYDECGKLNINSLALDTESSLESRQRLVALGFTVEMADSLLDWLDPDDRVREFGAEADWYLSSGRQHGPRQGEVTRLSELLLVRGFSTTRLFGADSNGNGWIDYEEQDQAEVFSSEGRAVFGLSEWLTVSSAESNRNAGGNARLNLNASNLPELYQKLDDRFGTDVAIFIAALRMNGPLKVASLRYDSQEAIAQRKALAKSRALEQSEDTLTFDQFRPVSFGGFSVDRPGRFRLSSLVDLVSQQVEARIDGEEVILDSPWDAKGALGPLLEQLEAQFCLREDQSRPGRINPWVAQREVLRTIPGMTQELAEKVVAARPGSNSACIQQSIGLLVDQRLMSLEQLRKFAPFLCSGGDVYTGVSWGIATGSQTRYAISFLLDKSNSQPRFQFQNHGLAPLQNR